MSGTNEDEIWRALADPTRREIVECLGSGARTTGDLVRQFSTQLVRTAVMKHLDVLESAGLIRVERDGRSRWNHLERKPLSGVATWLKRRSLTQQTSLQRLKKIAEENHVRSTTRPGSGRNSTSRIP